MEINKKKVIWLVCLNAQPPYCDTHLRHQKFADLLIEQGYNVYIIIGSYLHSKKVNLIPRGNNYKIEIHGEKRYIIIKTPSYSSNGLRRIFSIFIFGVQIYLNRNKWEKPYVVVHNTRTPFDSLVYFAAKRINAKYIAEVWDLWPKNFVDFCGLKDSNVFMKLAYRIEKFLYRNAKSVISTLEGLPDYVRSKKWDVCQGGKVDLNKFNYINNGIDLNEFNFNLKKYLIDDEDLLNPNTFKIIYLGSIREMNNLLTLIKAAELLLEYKNIVFLIYGDGNHRKNLEQYCKENGVKNVIFKETWVDIKYVPFILSNSSLNVLNFKKREKGKGYGFSQGKLFQYLASGKPILSNTTNEYDIINKYNAGISTDITNAKEYADLIVYFATLSNDKYNDYCRNVKIAAHDFDYKNLFMKYLAVIESV